MFNLGTGSFSFRHLWCPGLPHFKNPVRKELTNKFRLLNNIGLPFYGCCHPCLNNGLLTIFPGSNKIYCPECILLRMCMTIVFFKHTDNLLHIRIWGIPHIFEMVHKIFWIKIRVWPGTFWPDTGYPVMITEYWSKKIFFSQNTIQLSSLGVFVRLVRPYVHMY